MYIRNEDTICAPATVPGTGAISVIRISGPGIKHSRQGGALPQGNDRGSRWVYNQVRHSPFRRWYRPGRSARKRFQGSSFVHRRALGRDLLPRIFIYSIINDGITA